MKEKTVQFTANVIRTEELSCDDHRVRNSAIHAAKKAYAPYSCFNVGAAVLLNSGQIIEGNNQENIAYPSGLCAERVALFSAGSSYPEFHVVTLALVAIKEGEIESSISPCGACRQVMLETELRYGKPMRILMCGNKETVIIPSAKDLLPFCFGENPT